MAGTVSNESKSEIVYKEPKKALRKLGTCSQTLCYLLNREFGNPRVIQERASDPLAGGILQQGYQCGMLWGASLAVGAEAYRRFADLDEALGIAIRATQQIMTSFVQREHTSNCREITHCDFSNKLSFSRYFLSGRFLHCFKLAEQWAPEAIQAARQGLLSDRPVLPAGVSSCASEVAGRMGASDEEMVMVAGFAGGLGLSGSGCGALAAAVWMRSLAWCKTHQSGSAMKNPKAESLLQSFKEVTGSRFLCTEVSGQRFNNLEEHDYFIRNGGCGKVIETLTER